MSALVIPNDFCLVVLLQVDMHKLIERSMRSKHVLLIPSGRSEHGIVACYDPLMPGEVTCASFTETLLHMSMHAGAADVATDQPCTPANARMWEKPAMWEARLPPASVTSTSPVHSCETATPVSNRRVPILANQRPTFCQSPCQVCSRLQLRPVCHPGHAGHPAHALPAYN